MGSPSEADSHFITPEKHRVSMTGSLCTSNISSHVMKTGSPQKMFPTETGLGIDENRWKTAIYPMK
jgi:hypothetical protein